MTADENTRIVLRWVDEIFNQGNASALNDVFADDVLLHSARRLSRATLLADRDAFPDLHKTVDLLISEGDLVVLRGTNRGTHLGTFVLPSYGAFPPTGKRVRWSHVNIYRVIGGKIVENWEHVNWLQLLEQLGATISPGPRDTEHGRTAEGTGGRGGQPAGEVLNRIARRWRRGRSD